MSPSGATWVLCGGATHKAAPDGALRLDISTPERRGNLSVDIEGISQALKGNVPARFKDLIRVASYVLAADQAIGRGSAQSDDLGESWRRTLRFVIPVERPEVWNSEALLSALQQTLGFLSDDNYTFEFVPGGGSESEQLSFSGPQGGPFVSWNHIDEVVLFSGGMDSLGGAVDEVLGHDRDVILVSHRSANKTWTTQKHLLEELRRRSDGVGPGHVAIRMQKHEKELRRESTQRSRSFLYVALAATVARLVGLDRVRAYENGVVSLNLPISRQLTGARATRTTHPKVLRGFEAIISELTGEPFTVENPFELMSRTEVAHHLAELGAEDLVRSTVSCAKVRSSSKMFPHCGVCSQCIGRRFALLAAGLEEHDPAEAYEVDLFTGRRAKLEDRTMVLDFTDAADRFARCSSSEEFFSSFGEAWRAVTSMVTGMSQDAQQVMQEIFELHRRHGEAVAGVLDEAFRRHRRQLTAGELPAESLLVLMSSSGVAKSEALAAGDETGTDTADRIAERPDELPAPPPEHVFGKEGDTWTMAFPGEPQVRGIKHSKGYEFIRILLQNPGRTFTAFEIEAVMNGDPNPRYLPTIGEATDQQAIDQIVGRCKELRADLAEAEEFCDNGSVEKIKSELAPLEEYLTANVKKDGHPRTEEPERKRARTRIYAALDRAYKAIGKHHPLLGEHLRRFITSGFELRYERNDLTWLT